jgi:hypothetical protein
MNMEPIQGTNVSLQVALSAMQAESVRGKLDMAGMKLSLDTQKTEGQNLVQMLESLGTVIDTYV